MGKALSHGRRGASDGTCGRGGGQWGKNFVVRDDFCRGKSWESTNTSCRACRARCWLLEPSARLGRGQPTIWLGGAGTRPARRGRLGGTARAVGPHCGAMSSASWLGDGEGRFLGAEGPDEVGTARNVRIPVLTRPVASRHTAIPRGADAALKADHEAPRPRCVARNRRARG